MENKIIKGTTADVANNQSEFHENRDVNHQTEVGKTSNSKSQKKKNSKKKGDLNTS